MPAKTTAWPTVPQMGNGVDEGRDAIGCPDMRTWWKASGEDVLEFTDAFFDPAIVRRVIWRAVERDHAMLSEQLIYDVMIEDASVVPL